LTVGADLAAEPGDTAVARISWAAGSATVERLVVGADDAVLAEEIAIAGKAGIEVREPEAPWHRCRCPPSRARSHR